VRSRAAHLRLFLGAAVHLSGLRPDELTPECVFGTHLERVALALVDWWRARRDALIAENGPKVGRALGGQLQQTVITAGMMAYGRYAQLRHARLDLDRDAEEALLEASNTARGTRAIGRAQAAAAQSDKTPAEAALWKAYERSGALADAIAGLTTGEGRAGKVGAKRGAKEPEFRRVERIVKNTPAQWWLELLDDLLRREREMVRLGKDRGRGYYHLLRDCVELGVGITTGMRGEEQVRLTVTSAHYEIDDDGTPVLKVSAEERKNVKGQSAYVNADVLPHDVWRRWLDRGRAWFMSGQYEDRAEQLERQASGTRDEGLRLRRLAQAAKERASVRNEHTFLLVQDAGAGWGDVAGDELALKRRAASHGSQWQARMARRAVEAGKRIPAENYEWGRHPIRTAFGHAAFQAGGPLAAANYLGNTPRMAEQAYARVRGIYTDPTLMRRFRLRDNAIIFDREGAPAPTPGADPTPQRSSSAPVALDETAYAILPALRGLLAALPAAQRAALIAAAAE
jgi:hypothetical protein